jgi:hypothetical protein
MRRPRVDWDDKNHFIFLIWRAEKCGVELHQQVQSAHHKHKNKKHMLSEVGFEPTPEDQCLKLAPSAIRTVDVHWVKNRVINRR